MSASPSVLAFSSDVSEVSGNSFYGASTIAGGDGSRQPSANELAGAKAQGKRVAELCEET